MLTSKKSYNKCVACGARDDDFRISMHSFPKDAQRKYEWMKRLGLDKKNVSEVGSVCSRHFDLKQYSSTKRIRLTKTAVPTATYSNGQNSSKSRLPHSSSLQSAVNVEHSQLASAATVINLNGVAEPSPVSPVPSPAVQQVWKTCLTITSAQQNNATTQNAQQKTLSSNPVVQAHSVVTVLSTQGHTYNSVQHLVYSVSKELISHEITSSLTGTNTNLKRKLTLERVKNCRLRKRMSQPFNPEQTIRNIFGTNSNLCNLVLMQYDRHSSHASKQYSDYEKSIAFAIYFQGGKRGYMTLIYLGFRLPSVPSIHRWMQSLPLLTGINFRLVLCIKDSIDYFNIYEKDAILIWDEMRIKQLIQYDKNEDRFYGIVDHGDGRRRIVAANDALVFMVKGITGSWAFPLAYYFSAGSTDTKGLCRILDDVLNNLEELGFKVRICISDMGFTNQGVFRNLKVSEQNPFIERFGRKIYFIYDPCHLIKLIRTHLQKKRCIHYTGGVARWDDIFRSYELDLQSENRVMNKLNRMHFELTDKTRMKVKLATQIFSNTVSAGIKTFVALGNLHRDALETAEFVKKLNDMFDLLNISDDEDMKNELKSGKLIFKQKFLLLRFKEFVRSFKCPNFKKPDSFKGTLLTLQGVHDLIQDLDDEGYRYVLTRRLQQDALEHYFRYQRGCMGYCTNPTAKQFAQNWKGLFMWRLLRNNIGSNCEDKSESATQLLYSKLRGILCELTGAAEPLPKESLPAATVQQTEMERDGIAGDFFNLEENEEIGMKDYNVAVYIVNWACKKVKIGADCSFCKRLWNNSSPKIFSVDETLIFNRCTVRNTFNNPYEFSYCHSLSHETGEFFKYFVELFRTAITETMLLNGTKVMENVIKFIELDGKVVEYLEACPTDSFKSKNEEFKVIPSSETTLAQLRHV